MPNWIEGTIKLRGNSEDLKRFFAEGIEPARDVYGRDQKTIADSIECNFGEYNEVIIKDELHIKGTRRAFIQNCCVVWDRAYAIVYMPIRQAWAFCGDENDRNRWVEISRQFKLDIRLYGFECGMEFCQEVEIIDGEIAMSNEITYDNWAWECPMPSMGG